MLKTNSLDARITDILVSAGRKAKTLQCEIHVPSLQLELSYSSTQPDQRFHSASTGKLMTAALIFLAIEEGKFFLDTPVAAILPQDILEGLFMVRGEDFSGEVSIRQLLGHTSGVNDYFEGRSSGKPFITMVLEEPDRFFTPGDLLDFTRRNQKPIGKPCEKFHYSDTGYILLGLIVEKVFSMPFHRALRERLFAPLGMKGSSLCFYDPDFSPEALAPIYMKGRDIHLDRSLSCDFSGGGLSTTAHDLTLFLQALSNGRLLKRESLSDMSLFESRFRPGMRYGLGMMQLIFEQFFFLLKGLPRLQGHLGILGVHAWYHPDAGDTYVMNVGNADDMVQSFQTLIRIVQTVEGEKRIAGQRRRE